MELFKGIWRQRLWPCVGPWLLVCLLWFLAIAALRISWRAVSLQLALITGHFSPLQLSLLLPPITFTLYCLDIINGKTTAEDKASFKAGEGEKSAKSTVTCPGQCRSQSVSLLYSAELKLHSSFTIYFQLNVSSYYQIPGIGGINYPQVFHSQLAYSAESSFINDSLVIWIAF